MAQEVREEMNQILQSLNEKMGRLMPYRLAMVDPRSLVLAGKNARYMKPETFRNLTANIREDGNLTSIPFCYLDQGGLYHVLSGNHRVQAAIEAGVSEILVMFTEDLTESRRTAIQLSHNALEGEDDLQILKELWESIEDLDLRIYAGLDSEVLEKLDKIEFEAIREEPIEYRTVSLLFLPEEAEKAAEVFLRIKELFGKEEVYLASTEKWEKFFKLVSGIKTRADIKNSGAAFSYLLDLAEGAIDKLLPSTET